MFTMHIRCLFNKQFQVPRFSAKHWERQRYKVASSVSLTLIIFASFTYAYTLRLFNKQDIGAFDGVFTGVFTGVFWCIYVFIL